MRLRVATEKDRHELAEMIYLSTNFWYQTHGHAPVFTGGTEIVL